MALTIKWADSAWTDVEQIVEFIAPNSPSYAVSFVRMARDKARTLKIFPQRGRVVPEVGSQAIREVQLSSYRMIYRVTAEAVEILGIVHGARDLSAVWKREKLPKD